MTEAIRSLLVWASRETREPPETILGEIERQKLEATGWPRFLPDEIRAAWPNLSLDARLIAWVISHEKLDAFDADANLS